MIGTNNNQKIYQMLTIEEYFQHVFNLVRIEAGIEELKRIMPIIPLNGLLQTRMDKLERQRDEIAKKIDKEYKPLEIAPIEQYIDIELQFTK